MSDNGIIRIERRGRRKVQIGDGVPVDVDIIAFVNEWSAMEEQFRDEKRQIVPERRQEYVLAARDFIARMGFVEDLTEWEVVAFLKQMSEEADRLISFLPGNTPAKGSSPRPTEVAFTT